MINFLTNSNQYLALQVLLPCFAAIFSVVSGNNRIFVTIFSFLILLNSLMLSNLTWDNQELFYHFGGWIAPFGIEFKINILSAILNLLLNFVIFNFVLFFWHNHKLDINKIKDNSGSSLYYTLLFILQIGMNGILLTADFFNLYVFIEIFSLATYALLSLSSDKKSLLSAFNYLIIGTTAASFIVFGIGFLYSATGTLNIQDFIEKIPLVKNTKILVLGEIFFIVGFLIKAAIFPMHSWLVRVYSLTSAVNLVYIPVISSSLAFYILIKFLYYIIQPELFITFLNIIGVLAVIFGSFSPLFLKFDHEREDIRYFREMVIFSSFSFGGYILILLSLNNKKAAVLSIIFLLSDIIIKSLLFQINYFIEKSQMHNYQNNFSRCSYSNIFLIFVILTLLSHSSLPLSIGFVNKWSLFSLLLENNFYFTFMVILLSSLASLFYNYKLISLFYLTDKGYFLIKVNKFSLLSLLLFIFASYAMLYYYSPLNYLFQKL